MPEGVPLLKMENIGKEFFGNRVLYDVSFSLMPGEIMGLVGENGAGKSTLIRCLLGYHRFASGSVRVCGFDPASEERTERALEAAAVGQAVRAAIQRLPERQRVAVILKHIEDMPFSEIARERTVVASRCVNVAAGAGSVRSSAGT